MTWVCHISIEREKFKQSGVSGQILMVWAMKKVIFNREKCLDFLQSKGLKS